MSEHDERPEVGEQDGPEGIGEEEAPRESIRRLLGEGLANLLDSGAAIKKGQGLVSGVAQGTKDEALRIIGSEVRTFLDKVDMVDMVQRVVSGLSMEINAEIRFKRDEEPRSEDDKESEPKPEEGSKPSEDEGNAEE